MLSLLLCACGGTSPPPLGVSQTSVPTPTALVATPTSALLTPTRVLPAPPPEPIPTPHSVRVGSTASQAIYLYHSPTTGDRIQSYPEGTPLLVVGGDVEGDGLTWHFVRAPDGTEGYIPIGDTVLEAD